MSIRDRVLSCLHTGGKGTASHIARVVSANRGSTHNVLGKLLAAGLVAAEIQPGRGRWGNCYSIHPRAQEAPKPAGLPTPAPDRAAHVERALAARHPLDAWAAEIVQHRTAVGAVNLLDLDAVKAAGLNSAEDSARLIAAHRKRNPTLVDPP